MLPSYQIHPHHYAKLLYVMQFESQIVIVEMHSIYLLSSNLGKAHISHKLIKTKSTHLP